MHLLSAARAWLVARVSAARPRPTHEPDADRPWNESGQTLAEYALLLGLVAVTAIVSLTALGSATDGMFWEPINRVLGDVIVMITP